MKGLSKTIEEIFTAITFAEAGELDEAGNLIIRVTNMPEDPNLEIENLERN